MVSHGLLLREPTYRTIKSNLFLTKEYLFKINLDKMDQQGIGKVRNAGTLYFRQQHKCSFQILPTYSLFFPQRAAVQKTNLVFIQYLSI